MIGRALAGKPAQVVGDPSQPHSYTFVPDAGRTLAELGTRDGVGGEVFHVPNAPARSTRENVDLIAEQLGTPVKVQAAPKLMLRMLGLAKPEVREVIEMLYEFERPFLVDSSKAEQRLGLTATPLDEALATTIAWFRHRAES